MGAPGRRHRDRDRRLRVAGLDEPLNNLSSNHAEQDRDREEQPFRLRIPRVRLFPLGRVRLLILLLVRLHAPSYTKRNTKSPGQRGGADGPVYDGRVKEIVAALMHRH